MGCKDVGAFADSGYFQSSKVGKSKYKPITKMWLAFLFLQKQLCLHTQKLCDKLKLVKAYIVNGKELDINEYKK